MILAYTDNSTGYLGIGTSTDGVNFAGPTIYSQATPSPAASVVEYNNLLYVFYKDAPTSTIMQVSSSDGVHFSNPTQLLNNGVPVYTSTSVSAAVYGGNGFVIAYVDQYGTVQGALANTTTIVATYQISKSYTTANAPSLIVSDYGLAVAYQASNHMLVMNQSTNGGSLWNYEPPYPGILMGSAPNLTLYNLTELVVVFQSNDKYHDTVQTTGYSITTLTSPAPTFYDNILTGSSLGCLTNFSSPSGYTYYCALQSNEPVPYNLHRQRKLKP